MQGRVVTTVVTPAADISLVALADLKSDLQITATTDDAFLTRTILKASAAAAAYCNRVLALERVSDRWIAAPPYQAIFGYGPRVLQLSRYPVVLPTSATDGNGVTTTSNPIVVTITAADGSMLTLVQDTDFVVDAPAGLLIRLDAFGGQACWPSSGVVATYSAGFAPAPYDMQDAVTNLVKARLASRTRDPLLRSETIPGVSTSTWWVATGDGGNLPPDVADALDQYRVPVIA